jgi:hypothetical protein
MALASAWLKSTTGAHHSETPHLRSPSHATMFFYPMNTRQFFYAGVMAAGFTVIYSTAKVSAQAEDGNHFSTPIEIVVNEGTNGERREISHNGLLGPVGLHRSEQIALTLNVSSNWAEYPVSIVPLDGGVLIDTDNLQVKRDGTVNFTFEGGDTPGLYRVLVAIGGEQYQLQLYVAGSSSVPPPDCNP